MVVTLLLTNSAFLFSFEALYCETYYSKIKKTKLASNGHILVQVRVCVIIYTYYNFIVKVSSIVILNVAHISLQWCCLGNRLYTLNICYNVLKNTINMFIFYHWILCICANVMYLTRAAKYHYHALSMIKLLWTLGG